ncbi:OLC1v1015332C1 [Oldenlandia corymbosa var. corymbosa]|uniref:OLC1v1015332C1 n=1 Tax=Oldenlandia corymbosa var. corymbosa TaxID=529605 RepID=A0AAV1E2W2_OLDCO|nr:OLC1v1015332C1 [Oldenlandia corymbosa var. corymbosa]
MGNDAYENVVGGKLKLKGKALDVKAASGGISKRKKKKRNKDKEDKDHHHHSDADTGGSKALVLSDPVQDEEDGNAEGKSTEDSGGHWDDNLTPAERRYIEQKTKIDMHKLAKTANKSHRDRIEDFNQYLANMSEHYDIPKVGPG